MNKVKSVKLSLFLKDMKLLSDLLEIWFQMYLASSLSQEDLAHLL